MSCYHFGLPLEAPYLVVAWLYVIAKPSHKRSDCGLGGREEWMGGVTFGQVPEFGSSEVVFPGVTLKWCKTASFYTTLVQNGVVPLNI